MQANQGQWGRILGFEDERNLPGFRTLNRERSNSAVTERCSGTSAPGDLTDQVDDVGRRICAVPRLERRFSRCPSEPCLPRFVNTAA